MLDMEYLLELLVHLSYANCDVEILKSLRAEYRKLLEDNCGPFKE